jgi:PknH-like extracellular domain
MLVTGCSVAVGGTAQPAPDAAPRSLNGQIVKRVLLGRSALSRIVKQPLSIDPGFPPSFGGPEMLQGDRSAQPGSCIGVAVMLQQSVYQDSRVKNVAVETWRPDAESATVTRVKEGVISLPSAAEAEAVFTKFSRQWQKCDGETVPLAGGAFRLKVKVDGVQVAANVLTATTLIELDSPNPLLADAIPAGRAIGVRDNCLIEVEVDFDRPNPSRQGSGGADTSALDAAQVMRDKVGALS